MQDVYSSPGDPLFYLHHAGLDHLWADWQKLDSPKRLHEIEGNAISFDFNSTLGACSPPLGSRPDADPC